VHAVVLLPPDYGADAARRYPVLYLLHGHCGCG
jgi:enterochelin esterase-like enzyme